MPRCGRGGLRRGRGIRGAGQAVSATPRGRPEAPSHRPLGSLAEGGPEALVPPPANQTIAVPSAAALERRGDQGRREVEAARR